MVDGNKVSQLLMPDDEEDKPVSQNNTFQDTVKEMGKTLFRDYPKKTSNLSNENINGIIRAEVLNDYFDRNFGYRFKAIDTLIEQKQVMVVSKDGFGIGSIIEFVKSISATFEQTQIPDGLRGLIKR